jgi:hypothetical protein
VRWLTEMTQETVNRIETMKRDMPDFDGRIANSLLDFRQFQSESGKNSNLTAQLIFSRQLRAIKGFGIENCAAVTRAFKTPLLLRLCYNQCQGDLKSMLNVLNAGKLELMKAKHGGQKHDDHIPMDDGQPDLPRQVDNSDKIDLGAVVNSTNPKLFSKLLKEFQKDTGVKVRQIGKKQSQFVQALVCLDRYPK